MLTFEDEDNIKAYKAEVLVGQANLFQAWAVVDSNIDHKVMIARLDMEVAAEGTAYKGTDTIYQDLTDEDNIHLVRPMPRLYEDVLDTHAAGPVDVPYESVSLLNDAKIQADKVVLHTTYCRRDGAFQARLLLWADGNEYAASIC